MNLKISFQGINFIKQFETFKSHTYLCPAGHKTIGYGHLLRVDEQFNEIEPMQAEQLLYSDLQQAEQGVMRLISTPLTQAQHDMLVSFTFNLGSAALQRSVLRAKVNRGEHEEVPGEFARWIYVAGKALPGLVRRRYAEGQIYIYGYNYNL